MICLVYLYLPASFCLSASFRAFLRPDMDLGPPCREFRPRRLTVVSLGGARQSLALYREGDMPTLCLKYLPKKD